MLWLIVTAGVIAWIFLFLPSMIYLFTTGKSRFDNLLCRFNDDAVKLYFVKFFPSETAPDGSELRKSFEKKMKKRYGRCHYVMPLFLLIVTSGIALAMITISALKWQGIKPEFPSLPAIAASALLGAFMWTAYDQLDRFKTADLTPNDIYICCYRFLIAVPMGYGFAFTVQEPVGVPLAFFLGTFPASTLMTLGRRFVTKKMDLGDF